jgi:DNA-binding NarL/FixJ family response regulator
MATLKVLLVEDHTLMRQGIKELLGREPDITVVGEVGDGSQALLLVERLRPDVVLMDLSLPGVDGIEATRQIHERCPAVRVLVLSMHQSKAYVSRALRAGASGYVLKQSTAAELALALRAVAAGNTFLSPAIAQILIDDYVQRPGTPEYDDDLLSKLAPREREVLQLIATGFSNRQIAAQLHVSIKTVEAHRRGVMRKLGVSDRTGLVERAIKGGLVRTQLS